MNLKGLDRAVLYVGVLAIALAAVGILPFKHFEQSVHGHGARLAGTGGGLLIVGIEQQKKTPSPKLNCYSDPGWLSVSTDKDKPDRFIFSNETNNELTIVFGANQLRDAADSPVVSAISLPKKSVAGPFYVDSGIVGDCSNNGTPANCFLQYDIQLSAASCKPPGYFTGVQVTRTPI